MIVRQFRGGHDRNFSYIIADEMSREAAAIDPLYPPSDEQEFIREQQLLLKYLIATHDHADHTAGIDVLKDKLGGSTAFHERAYSHHAISLRDGGSLFLGNVKLTVIHTPGHTTDSICLLGEGNLFTGDTLFVGKVGGTGYGEDARAEYTSLHEKIMTLPPETKVWPGHDYGVRRSSTIGDELRENPFILRNSFESFLELKKNWLEYKRIHGIA